MKNRPKLFCENKEIKTADFFVLLCPKQCYLK